MSTYVKKWLLPKKGTKALLTPGDHPHPISKSVIKSSSKKLSKKNLSPYPIIAQVGTLSFTIRFPDSMRAVHPVFHVSQLEPATLNTIPNWSQPPPPPIKVDGEPEFEITKILDSKFD